PKVRVPKVRVPKVRAPTAKLVPLLARRKIAGRRRIVARKIVRAAIVRAMNALAMIVRAAIIRAMIALAAIARRKIVRAAIVRATSGRAPSGGSRVAVPPSAATIAVRLPSDASATTAAARPPSAPLPRAIAIAIAPRRPRPPPRRKAPTRRRRRSSAPPPPSTPAGASPTSPPPPTPPPPPPDPRDPDGDDLFVDLSDDAVKPGTLTNVAGIKFRDAGTIHEYDAGDASYARGDRVMVETDRGPLPATVAIASRRMPSLDPLRRILRPATDADARAQEKNAGREREAYVFCRQRIRERGLPMKMVRVEYPLQSGKVLFYFSSE